MPIKLCSCGEIATYRGRCKQCNRGWSYQTHRNKNLYNSHRWQIQRRRVLFEQPLCECGMIATDVDHIVAYEDGGNFWDRANMQGLCASCHSAKTSREVRAR
jgi:5-methylcytosine-specific restriction enzyme A